MIRPTYRYHTLYQPRVWCVCRLYRPRASYCKCLHEAREPEIPKYPLPSHSFRTLAGTIPARVLDVLRRNRLDKFLVETVNFVTFVWGLYDTALAHMFAGWDVCFISWLLHVTNQLVCAGAYIGSSEDFYVQHECE